MRGLDQGLAPSPLQGKRVRAGGVSDHPEPIPSRRKEAGPSFLFSETQLCVGGNEQFCLSTVRRDTSLLDGFEVILQKVLNTR